MPGSVLAAPRQKHLLLPLAGRAGPGRERGTCGGDEDQYGLVAVLALVAGVPQDEAVLRLGFHDSNLGLSGCLFELVSLEVDVETL
jgi:hypothetical protein